MTPTSASKGAHVTGKPAGDRESVQNGPTQSTKIVRLALDKYSVGCSGEGMPFAVELQGPPIALPFRGGRSSLRAALAQAYYQEFGAAPSSGAVTDALLALEGRAMQATLTELPLRVTQDEEAIWLDLGRRDGSAVKITEHGRAVTATPPVIWRRSELTSALPMPAEGGSLDDLWELTNVAPSDRSLVLAWLVAALIPEIPHPVLLLQGLQGTAKTTTARLLVQLIDPSPAPLRCAPRDVQEWAVATSGSWVAAIDNVSTIPTWWADAICRAVTGDGHIRRRLYSDDGLTVLTYRRVLLLTGIDIGALRGDLADRLLTVELDPIRPDRRCEERALREAMEAARPRLIGALLDLTSQVLAVLPGIELEELPRMADFAKIVAAVDEVLGTDAADRYAGQAAGLAAEVVEGDDVARAVRDFIAAQACASWQGTAETLLDALTPDRPTKYWPTSPRALSGRLRQSSVALAAVGVRVDNRRSNGIRVITLVQEVSSGAASDSAGSADVASESAGWESATGTVERLGIEVPVESEMVDSAGSAGRFSLLSMEKKGVVGAREGAEGKGEPLALPTLSALTDWNSRMLPGDGGARSSAGRSDGAGESACPASDNLIELPDLTTRALRVSQASLGLGMYQDQETAP